MKMLWGDPPLSDEKEKELEQEIAALVRTEQNEQQQRLPEAYWHNLLIRTNRRVDEATSAKALSISWAARVAIPGVIAILSFLIGFYYYIPEKNPDVHSLAEALLVAPANQLDSLVASDVVQGGDSLSEMSNVVLALSGELSREYLIETTATHDLLDPLSDDEVNQVLAVLGSTNK
jgi:hypothetical protein